MQASRCHSDTIRLELVSNKPHKDPNSELSQPSPLLLKSDLVREVTRCAEEAQLAQEVVAHAIPEEEYLEYRQTKGRSLYMLLEEIRDLALLDVSGDCGM